MMKKLFCVVIATLLLLCGCGINDNVNDNVDNSDNAPTLFINAPNYCQIDDSIFLPFGASLRRVSNAFPEERSLCLDPLCKHTEEDFCPELPEVHSVVTDGKRLYVLSRKIYSKLRQITSIGKDGSGRKVLCEYTIGAGDTNIFTDGEYVYYMQWNEDETDYGYNGYRTPMRVPCDGGKAEAFLDSKHGDSSEIYVDEDNYYITDNGKFIVINRKTGYRQTFELPVVDIDGIVLQGDGVYLLGVTELCNYGVNTNFISVRRALWKWNGSAFDMIVSDIGQFAFDEHGIWYTPKLAVEDYVLLGTKDFYNGKGQSPYEFIRTWTGELVYYDYNTEEKTIYRYENINLLVEPRGVANGYIIAAVADFGKFSVDFDNVNLKPESDGTVTVHGAIKPEREVIE